MKVTFDHIENHKQAILDELFLFLSTKSISTINLGVAECAELLAGMMKKCGIKTTIYETPRHPVVYGEIGARPDAPTVLIYGHYDVQPPEPLDLWKSDPFKPEIRQGKIYARGASDNKSQLFAHIKGLEAYLKTHHDLPINIKYIFEGEEEIGSPSLEPFFREHKNLLACDLAIVSDSHIHESGKPMLILGLKGMAYVEITLNGANRELHSMKAPCVPNPVWRMVELLSCLRKDDKILIEGFYDDVRPPLPLEIEAVNKIPYDKQAFLDDLSIDHFVNNRTGDHYYYNLIFEPTCNVAGIYGGYTGAGSKTVIPNKVSVKIDMRLVPNQKPDVVYAKLAAHLKKQGFGDAEIKRFGSIIPSRTAIDDPAVEKIKKAVIRAWGEEPIVFPGIGGAGPNYLFTDLLGVPCVVVPFASSDQNNHAPNECMEVSGFFNGIKTSACIIDELAKKE